MDKVVSFQVHKNTRDKRRARETTKELINTAKSHGTGKTIRGYAIVSWDDQHNANVDFVCDLTVPTSMLPDFVSGCLRRRIGMLDGED